MNDISRRLSDLIVAKAISTRRMEELTKIPKSAIQRYITGTTDRIPIDRLKAMASVLGVTPAYLMGLEDKYGNSIYQDRPANALQISTRPIPLAGVVGAGECIDFGKESTMESVYAVRGDYALEVGGDSMEPTIMRGDIITVSISAEIRDGDIAVVQIDDGATIKRVTHLPDGSLLLISDNGHYPPRVIIAVENENCHVQGRVMSIVKEV